MKGKSEKDAAYYKTNARPLWGKVNPPLWGDIYAQHIRVSHTMRISKGEGQSKKMQLDKELIFSPLWGQ